MKPCDPSLIGHGVATNGTFDGDFGEYLVEWSFFCAS